MVKGWMASAQPLSRGSCAWALSAARSVCSARRQRAIILEKVGPAHSVSLGAAVKLVAVVAPKRKVTWRCACDTKSARAVVGAMYALAAAIALAAMSPTCVLPSAASVCHAKPGGHMARCSAVRHTSSSAGWKLMGVVQRRAPSTYSPTRNA